MNVFLREHIEQQEHETLCSEASFASATHGRTRPTSKDILRTEYQRDKDKILHSKAFRRLSHKTQVFLAPQGDHFRTRLTHTLEVAQISRTIARALALNEDLVEAIALGHDLGHTPFGHTGEDAIRSCMEQLPHAQNYELFSHNVQSLRVVEVIENNGQGLNLTEEVRNGIVCHTGPVQATTLEGRIVALSDRIAYVNHDIDDAIRAGILQEADLPETTRKILGENHSQRIATMVLNTVEYSAKCGNIRMQDTVWNAMMELRQFLFEKVYRSETVMREVNKAYGLVQGLFLYYLENPATIPAEYIAISNGDNVVAARDYVAGMTDRYARACYEELFLPQDITTPTQ